MGLDNGSEVFRVDDGGNVGIGDVTPDNKLDIEFGNGFTSGNQILTRGYINHNNGSGSANGTAIQGYAKTNSHTGTATMIGIHGYAQDVATGNGGRTISLLGIKGEAESTTNGVTTSYGGFFTASGADSNYAIYSNQGEIQFSNLSGLGTRMVVVDQNGLLSTQSISGGGADNDWVESSGSV